MEMNQNKPKKVIRVKAKVAKQTETDLFISTPFIKLDAALKLCGIAQTGGHAKIMITEEQCVFVNGERCTVRGKKLTDGDELRCGRDTFVIRTQKI